MRAVRHSALVVVVVVVASACLVGNAHAAGVVTISVGSSSLVEGDSGARSLHIPVTLNIPATTTVTVNYAVEAGNATAGNLGTSSHFRPRTGRLTWRPSTKTGLTTTEQFIAVPIAPNVVADGDETFAVVLSNPTGGAFIHQSVGSDGVLDDDPWVGSPRVSVGDAAVFAGVAGNDRTRGGADHAVSPDRRECHGDLLGRRRHRDPERRLLRKGLRHGHVRCRKGPFEGADPAHPTPRGTRTHQDRFGRTGGSLERRRSRANERDRHDLRRGIPRQSRRTESRGDRRLDRLRLGREHRHCPRRPIPILDHRHPRLHHRKRLAVFRPTARDRTQRRDLESRYRRRCQLHRLAGELRCTS